MREATLDITIESKQRTPLAWYRASFPYAAAFAAAALVLFAPAVLNDPDSWWHVAAGTWMLAHLSVPPVDPFSFSMAGQPWVAHEWLAEVAMALAYAALGWSGVVALFAAAVAVMTACLARYLARHLRPLAASVVLLLGVACVGPSLLARPHLLALALLVPWLTGLLRAHEKGERPPSPLLLLMVAWANLHGSFIFGLALAVPIALEAMLDARRENGRAREDASRIVRGWTMFLVAAVLSALITPHGVEGLRHPFEMSAMKHIVSIGEWQPLDLRQLHPIEIALVALAYALVTRRVRISAPRLLIVAGLVWLAFAHGRHEMLAGVVGAAVLAQPLGRALGSTPQTLERPGWRVAALWLAGAALLFGLRFAQPVARGDSPTSPVTALAHVPVSLLEEPVFNSYEFGGYLIFQHVRPFIDGRADMYGDAFMFAFLDAMRPDRAAFERLVEQYRIRWALLDARASASAMIATMPGWRRLYADSTAVVYVRDTP